MSNKPYFVNEMGKIWGLVERPTGQIITQYTQPAVARKQANFLNGGNGFNGWTPPFILRGT